MTDAVFTPAHKDPGINAPGNAELVYLRETLLVIKGVFQNPLTDDGAEVPLPPHRFALVNKAEKLFLEGTTSDDKGLSTILKAEPGGSASGEWALWLIPIFKDNGDTSEVVTSGEVWIDVDKREWVRATELGDRPWIEKRPLLRIPRWTSTMKAKAGGFKETLPGAASFAETGLVKTSELAPHGTRDTPWTIAIDHGWLKTFVQFRLYSLKQKSDITVPQGLVVEALAMTGENYVRVGASSVRRKDGSIYVLHARDPASSTNLDYMFRTPPHSTFTYADADGKWATSSDRMIDMTRMEHEYMLPVRWHSFGHEAWEGPSDATASSRKVFDTIRTKGAKPGTPICFHLDDLVLSRGTRPIALDGKKTRIAIYTALAALRDPKTAGGRDLPFSKYELTKFPIRAEEGVIQRGKEAKDQALFYDYEGQLYHRENEFVMGALGVQKHIGARTANIATPIADYSSGRTWERNDGHRLYLFDARWVPISYDGKAARLAHIVCYVSCFIDDTKAKAKNPDAREAVETWLVESANRWDQKHPGISGSAVKDYAIISQTGFAAKSTVIKARHVFGLRSDANGNGTTPQAITIKVLSQPGRPSAGDPMHLFCISGSETDETKIDPDWASGKTKPAVRPYPWELDTSSGHVATDRVDSTALGNINLAHELGHESGFLDEYLDGINIRATYKDAVEFIPRFRQQGYWARPYAMDSQGMMSNERLPRLRYMYNFVDQLHIEAATALPEHWLRAERPFVAQYIVPKTNRRLRHAMPRTAPDYKPTISGPWGHKTQMQGLCNVSFYPTSEDEGTIGPAFLETGTLANSMDGILVVHPMFWLRFGADIPKTGDQWNAFVDWAKRYSSVDTMVKFMIETAGVPYAKRVAILFQPRFEFSPIVSDNPAKDLTTVELLIHKAGGKPQFTAGTPPVLSMDKKDVGNWIMRYALNRPATISPNDDPTKASDLTILTTVLAQLLGRPEKGTVKAYP